MENEMITHYCQVVGCMEHIPLDVPYCDYHKAKTPKLTVEDYQSAIYSQDACNLSGLVIALAEIMPKLSAIKRDTKWRNEHPIVRLYVHQMSALSGNGESISMESFCYCLRIAKLVVAGRLNADMDYSEYSCDKISEMY